MNPVAPPNSSAAMPLPTVRDRSSLDRRRQAAERRYRDLLLETCDIINLANLPEQDRHIAQKSQELKLRSLFIPLRVQVEAESGEDMAGPGQEDMVWEALEKRRTETIRGRRGAYRLEGKRERVPVGKRLAEAKRLVILGDPGAGKTTLTRWITTTYLLRLKQDKDWQEIPDVKTLPDYDWLPIIVRCRDLDIDRLTGSLDDILNHTLRKAELSASEASDVRALLQKRLQDGQALLMLDGLDEITDPVVRARFCQQVEQIVVAYPDAPIIATSRIVGYREMGYKLGRGFEHLTLVDLTPEEKDDFARRWCRLTEVPERRNAAADELINDIHSAERIERLTGNPMLLTTMALVKRKVGKLPSRRADLYWEAVQVLLNWRREVDEPLDPREAIPQLEYLAYAMCDRGNQQLRQDEIVDLFARMRADYPNIHAVHQRSPEDFLKRLEARTGILVEAGLVRHLGMLVPVYEFRHLTFQEYLAARALVDGRFPGRDANRSLSQHIAPLAGRTTELAFTEYGPKEAGVVENWREALRLCVAICNDDDVDSVLYAILTPQDGEPPVNARARAILAALCLADEPNASVQVAEQVFEAFALHIREGDGSGSLNTGIDAAAMALASTRWASTLKGVLIEEYCRRSRSAFDRYGGVVAMMGEVKAPQNEVEVSTWMTKQTLRLKDENVQEAVEAALLVMALAFRGKAKLVSGLINALLNRLSDIAPASHASAWALAWLNISELEERKIWNPALHEIEAILAFVSDPNSDPATVRFLAWILGREKIQQAVEPLIYWLHNPESDVGRDVAVALGRIGSDKSIAPLISCLEGTDSDTRKAAAEALGTIGSEIAVTALIAHLDDSDKGVRDAVIAALGELKSAAAVPALTARLNDSDQSLRGAAAAALGKIKSETAVPALIARLDDSDESVRRAAVEALGQIGSEAAVAALIARLDNSDVSMRRAAVGGLAQRIDEVGRKILSRDLDGLHPFLDPCETIEEAFAVQAASELELPLEDLKARYEALAERFHLRLAWQVR